MLESVVIMKRLKERVVQSFASFTKSATLMKSIFHSFSC